MRVLVCGGRDFGHDFDEKIFIYDTLDELNDKYDFTFVITGLARGVDTYARFWATMNKAGSGKTNLPFQGFKADWDKYGKRAGYLRNVRMLEEGKPDLVIAFPGGVGTDMMIRLAKEAGVPVEIVPYPR